MRKKLKKSKIFIETYGCSLNLSDAQTIEAILIDAGYKISDNEEEADCIIINTCTVKDTTYKKFRNRLKELTYSGKKIIVSGCIPAVYNVQEFLENISFIGTRNLSKIVETVESTLAGHVYKDLNESTVQRLDLPRKLHNPVIEIIPIAQGCLGQCAYCQTRLARGTLKSYPIEKIVSRMENGISEGVKEFWLTAQDCGAYGLDIGTSLPSLITAILKSEHDFKLRIGMANPQHVLKMLNDLLKIYNDPRLFAFLHIPVQSGSNKILGAMNRQYCVDDIYFITETIREHFDEFTFSTDVIVGFPGETDMDFFLTEKLLLRLKPATVNRSRFSPRPKTEAARMKQLPSSIISERSRKITEIVKDISLASNKTWFNWNGEILIDEEKNSDSFLGRNFAYKPIVIKKNNRSNKMILGERVNVKIIDYNTFHLIAEILDK